MPRLREKLLVEKCLLTLIEDNQLEEDDRTNWMSTKEPIHAANLQLDFLSFLTSNLPEEVDYGISFLINNKDKYANSFKVLFPMILEYQNYGLNGQLFCEPLESIQQRKEQLKNEPVECPIKKSWTSNILDSCKSWFRGRKDSFE